MLQTSAFDAAVLDVMMPGLDGIELTRRGRAAGNQIPSLMLTARDAPADVIRGLDAGADDYLVEPFPFKVLLARVRAVTRRSAQPPVERLQVADLCLHPVSREVTCGGVIANLNGH